MCGSVLAQLYINDDILHNYLTGSVHVYLFESTVLPAVYVVSKGSINRKCTTFLVV